MWRRYGDDLYALLVLVVFTFEALTLGVLTWAFALSAARALGGGDLITILVASVAVTALALIAVGSYVIAYHVISTRRERHRRLLLDRWTARWVSVLFEGRRPPRAPLPPEGVETLLDLREHLTGAEGERVEGLVRRYDIGRRLLELAEDVAAHVGDRDAEVRSASLRALGRLGILPRSAVRGALEATRDPIEFVRVQATRTAVLLPSDRARTALWRGLGDESWWVRRAAAHALLELGVEGPGLVQRASRTHPDRYARQMALQVLLDAGRLDAHDARALREA